MDPIQLTPIGIFHALEQEKYQLEQQPLLDRSGEIELFAHQNFEQALEDLASFSHIWVLFLFDQATSWRPKVQPPRGVQKRGVFATRSPHRPNPIGLTSLPLLQIEKRTLYVGAHDLLDQTPVLDIKPYLPYADCHPEANSGWLEDHTPEQWRIDHTAVEQSLCWLQENGLDLLPLIRARLTIAPTPGPNRRVAERSPNHFELAVKSWRVHYHLQKKTVYIEKISSGYTAGELLSPEDPWKDKALHRGYTSFQKGKNL